MLSEGIVRVQVYLPENALWQIRIAKSPEHSINNSDSKAIRKIINWILQPENKKLLEEILES